MPPTGTSCRQVPICPNVEPEGWLALYPDEFEPVVLTTIGYWSRRAFHAGRASAGCAESLAELWRLDPDSEAGRRPSLVVAG